MTSLWMLEKEHESADEYFHAYFQAMRRYLEQPSGSLLIKGIDDLLHACRLVARHLETEEDILLPV